MNSWRFGFPQISRFFSATFLWLALVSLVGLNLSFRANADTRYASAIAAIFREPASWNIHLTFGQELWQAGAKESAAREMLLAQELFPSEPTAAARDPRVLGVTTTPIDILEAWKEEPVIQQNAFNFWKQMVATHPDYRDGFVELSYLSYIKGDIKGARDFIHQAQTLDPNSPTIAPIVEFLAK